MITTVAEHDPKIRGGTVKFRALPRGEAWAVARDPLFAAHRYPAEPISYAVSLYDRFPLSLRTGEEMLAALGVAVTYDTIQPWGLKFGRKFANRIRRRGPWRGDNWSLMRPPSPWPERSTGSGGRPTSRALFSMPLSKADVIRGPSTPVSRAPEEAVASASGPDHRQAEVPHGGQARDLARHRIPQRKGLNNRTKNPHQPTR
jgi:putative transposase